MTIAGNDSNIVGTWRYAIFLPTGTRLIIANALLYPESKCTLLTFKDICANRFHVETYSEDDGEYLLMTKFDGYDRKVVQKHLPSHQDYTTITLNLKKNMLRWNQFLETQNHLNLGMIEWHPGLTTMREIINHSIGHEWNTKDFPNQEDFVCTACTKGKLIIVHLTLK